MEFREMRKRAGLSVNEVAERLGVSGSTYRKWELETNSISLDMALRCADMFHCTLDELGGRKKVEDERLSHIAFVYKTLDEDGHRLMSDYADMLASRFLKREVSSRVNGMSA